MKKTILVLGVTFLALLIGQNSSVFAATKKFQSSNWVTACKKAVNGKNLCRMTRAVRQAGGKKPLMVTAIQRDLKNKGYMLVLRLPHGLNLPLGVQLQIDKQKARRLAVLSSDRGGTFTRVNLSDKVLGSLKNGNQLTITFATIGGQRFVIPVSLSGFTAAYTQLKGMR
jgi:invasion protein IalB